MGEPTNYKIRLTFDAKKDIVQIKRYILHTFKYRETAEAFSKNIRNAISKLSPFSEAYSKTGLLIHLCGKTGQDHCNPSLKGPDVLAVYYETNSFYRLEFFKSKIF